MWRLRAADWVGASRSSVQSPHPTLSDASGLTPSGTLDKVLATPPIGLSYPHWSLQDGSRGLPSRYSEVARHHRNGVMTQVIERESIGNWDVSRSPITENDNDQKARRQDTPSSHWRHRRDWICYGKVFVKEGAYVSSRPSPE